MQELSPVEQQEIPTAMKTNPTLDSSSTTTHTVMAGPPRLSTFVVRHCTVSSRVITWYSSWCPTHSRWRHHSLDRDREIDQDFHQRHCWNNSTQQNKKVAGWACRLDDLVAKLQDRHDKDKPLVHRQLCILNFPLDCEKCYSSPFR